MGLFNYPDRWHNRAMNSVHAWAHSKKPPVSKLLATNLKTVFTGAADIFTTMLKLAFVQPAGMVAKTALGTCRIVKRNLAQNLYDDLPGATDWVRTAGKLAVLSLGEFISIMATVGALVTPKIARISSRFQANGGVYKKEPLPWTPEGKAFAKLVVEANKLSKIELIQSRARSAKDAALRFRKEVEKQKTGLNGILQRSLTAAVQTLDASRDKADQAAKSSKIEAQKAKDQAILLQTLLKQAETKLKAMQTNQATFNRLKLLEKAGQTAATVAEADAISTWAIASKLKELCEIRKSDAARISSYQKEAEAAVEEAKKMSAEAEAAKKLTDLLKIDAEGIARTHSKNQAALKPLDEKAAVPLKRAADWAKGSADRAQLFTTWLEWGLANRKHAAENRWDIRSYESFIKKIQNLQADADPHRQKIGSCAVAVKASVERVKDLYEASLLRVAAEIFNDETAALSDLVTVTREANRHIQEAQQAWKDAVKAAEEKKPDPANLNRLIPRAKQSVYAAVAAVAKAKDQEALANKFLRELKILEKASPTGVNFATLEADVAAAVAAFKLAEKALKEAKKLEQEIRDLQAAIVESNQLPPFEEIYRDATAISLYGEQCLEDTKNAIRTIKANFAQVEKVPLENLEDLVTEAKARSDEVTEMAARAERNSLVFTDILAEAIKKQKAFHAIPAQVATIRVWAEIAEDVAKKMKLAATEAVTAAQNVEAACDGRVAKEIRELKIAASKTSELITAEKARVAAALAHLEVESLGNPKGDLNKHFAQAIKYLKEALHAMKDAEDHFDRYERAFEHTYQTLITKYLIKTADFIFVRKALNQRDLSFEEAHLLLIKKIKNLTNKMSDILKAFDKEATEKKQASEYLFIATQKIVEEPKTFDEALLYLRAAEAASAKAASSFKQLKPDLRPINDSSDARLFWRLKRGNFRLLYSSMSKIAPFKPPKNRIIS